MQFVITAVRTGVQAGIGLTVAWLLAKGITIDQTALEVVADGVVIGVVTIVLRWLETRFTWLVPILSLGTSKTGPSYTA